MNQPGAQVQNLHQGSTVATIHPKPRMKDDHLRIVTRDGTKTGDDGPWKQVQLVGKKKVAFNIATKPNTFFEAKQVIGRNLGKIPIIDMLFSFDPSVEVGPSWQHGTLHKFFEIFVSLERDSDALVKLEALMHLPNKTVKDFAVNSLQKRKTGKEMRMNIQIGDYEVDSVILDLGSDVNILTKQTW